MSTLRIDIQISYTSCYTYFSDQRITQDIDKLAETLRELVENLIISPLSIGFYTWKCWEITGYMGPLCIYGYFIFSAVTSRLLINPIVDAVFFKESAEGYFRFLHVRFRQFTESITFSRGESEAKSAADDSLENLMCSQLNVIYKELPLKCKSGRPYFLTLVTNHFYVIFRVENNNHEFHLVNSLAAECVVLWINFELCYYCDPHLSRSLRWHVRSRSLSHYQQGIFVMK